MCGISGAFGLPVFDAARIGFLTLVDWFQTPYVVFQASLKLVAVRT